MKKYKCGNPFFPDVDNEIKDLPFIEAFIKTLIADAGFPTLAKEFDFKVKCVIKQSSEGYLLEEIIRFSLNEISDYFYDKLI
jgi:hypothetical protein